MKKKRAKKPAVKNIRKAKIKKTKRALQKKGNKKTDKKFGKKELVFYRKLILDKKEEIVEDINHISEDTLKKSQKEASGDISGYAYHMADVATDTYDREFSLAIATNDRKALYELDDALKKIEDGSFGICEDCKSSIAKTRLKAVPYARLCVKCQEKREKG